MYVFSGLETEQGIQRESWKMFIFTIDTKTSQQMRKSIENYNTCVLALLVLYENRKFLIYKLVGFVIYCILYKYVCIDYCCLHKFKNFLCHIEDLKTLFMMSFH